MGYDFLSPVPKRICYLLHLKRFTIFITRLQDAVEGTRGDSCFSEVGEQDDLTSSRQLGAQ